ncbi:MAG: class I SAM-dependent methyltransferase [Desulfobacterales bacterium]|nr:class I SAM-dependent methyltransferase [Desulfobacterales bacterium]
MFKPRGKSFPICKQVLRGKKGFEIGGPSHIFSRKGLLPIYPIVGQLDNCNFNKTTVWEKVINEGLNFRYDKKRPLGYQFINDATDLSDIPSEAYDFILSSHTLEHIANPLRALYEWIRVLKVNGIIVLIVPHKDGTFDHLRPISSLEHLIEDFKQETGEDDLSHLPEILKFHDLKMDPPAGNFEAFRKRSENNFENRCLHHHVFDAKLVIAIINHIGLHICYIEPLLPFHIIAIGKRITAGAVINNQAFLEEQAKFRIQSPFPSDQV